MTVRTMISAVFVVVFCVGCVSSSPPPYRPQSAAQQADEARAVMHKITDPNFMPPVYQECTAEKPVILAEGSDGNSSVSYQASQKCQAVTTRKGGVNRPMPVEDNTKK